MVPVAAPEVTESGFSLPRVTYPLGLPAECRSLLVFPALVEAVIAAGPGVRLPKVRKLEVRYGLPLQRARRLFRRLQSRGLAVLDASDRNRPVYVTCAPPDTKALLAEAAEERARGMAAVEPRDPRPIPDCGGARLGGAPPRYL